MPPVEEMDLHQDAVYWNVTGKDEFNEPVLSAPASITVRWVTSRREVTGPDGKPIAVDATVISVQDLAIGTLMWLGDIDDYGDTTTHEIMEIITKGVTPSIDARVTRYEYSLARFRSTIPSEE